MKNNDAKLSGEYEKLALTALYLQAAEEKGRPLNITEREAIRNEFLLSKDKGVRPRRIYRRRNSTKEETESPEFCWKQPVPARKFRSR